MKANDNYSEQLIEEYKLIDPTRHSVTDRARIRELVNKYHVLNRATIEYNNDIREIYRGGQLLTGVPQLYDALAVGCSSPCVNTPGHLKINEQDVRDIIRLIPLAKWPSSGEIRYGHNVPPLVIAILNQSCPLSILDLLVDTGLNFVNQFYWYVGGRVTIDADDTFGLRVPLHRLMYVKNLIKIRHAKTHKMLRAIRITRIILVTRDNNNNNTNNNQSTHEPSSKRQKTSRSSTTPLQDRPRAIAELITLAVIQQNIQLGAKIKSYCQSAPHQDLEQNKTQFTQLLSVL